MRERWKLVQAYANGEASMAELCRRFGVSRKTGHKWWHRYCEEGKDGLRGRSSRPRRSPSQTPEEVERAIIRLRRTYPCWGPRKLRVALKHDSPDLEVPAASTIGEVLKRNGLVPRRRRKRKSLPASSPFAEFHAPNAVWCADFKGQFPTGAKTCYPLTIVDGYSRFLIACRVLSRTRFEDVKKVFFDAFKAHGIPDVIRTDNGPPFASKGAGGLSRLSVWWMRLGIIPERIRPGHPEENGRQERFHRTLKLETARPPAGGLGAQQRRFDRFLPIYNEVRPHEALGQRPPATFYEPSARPAPERYVEPEYPDAYEVFRTNKNGAMNWRGYRIQLNTSLDRQLVGVVRVGSEFDVRFGPVWLGRFKQPRRNTRNIRLITAPWKQQDAGRS